MIDIHSHLLPGIDDGSRSPEQSMEVLQLFVEHGVTGVVLTPHVTASEIEQDPEGPVDTRAVAFEQLRATGLEAPRLHLGFEIMLDQPMTPLLMSDRRYSLAGSRYYLVEFPYSVVPHFAGKVLETIAQTGAVPVVAHPERYSGCAPEAVARWRDAGAKIQVDATELTRPTVRGRRARQLLATGLADLIAADNHGNRRLIGTGVKYLAERGAAHQATLLAEVNPLALVDDGDLEPVPPVEFREGVLDRWRRFVGG